MSVPLVLGSHGERDWDEQVVSIVHTTFRLSLTNLVLFCGTLMLKYHQRLLHGEQRHT